MSNEQQIADLIDSGDEHIARERFGDAAVDDWFRRVWDVDPDAMRAGW